MPKKKRAPRKKPVDLAFAFKQKPEAAIKYFREKGYTLSGDWHEVLGEAHARAFTAAQVTKMDILQDLRGAVDQAIADGQTFREFQKNLEPTLKKKGWWGKGEVIDKKTGEVRKVQLGSPRRLRTIYHTNMKSAYSAGREEFFQKNKAARPYGQFVTVLDDKRRRSHARLHGKVFPLDDPFWDSFTPPLDFNCRCRKRALSAAAVKRRGLKVLGGKGRLVREDRLVSKRTGETRKVTGYRLPGGGKIFPRAGFDNNPWKAAFQPNLEKYDYDIARKYVEGAVTGPAFKRFFKGKDANPFPIAVLNPETKKLIGQTKFQTIRMKSKTRSKITTRKHRNISAEDMLRAQEAVDDGMVVQPKRSRLKREFFLERDGYLWIFPIKGTSAGLEPLTFFKIPLGTDNHKRFLAAKLRDGKVLRKQKK